MPIEVEQKYPVVDREALLARIANLDAVVQPPVTQVDTYYAHPARDFAATDEALRVRRVGKKNCITYKGPKLDKATKTRREIELPLDEGERSAEQWEELLGALSFRSVATVAKVREVFRLSREGQAIEIAVDCVEQVGDFAEIEIVVDNEAGIEAAQQILQSLATDLQLMATERRSYLELLLSSL